jgi:hypothetical protein
MPDQANQVLLEFDVEDGDEAELDRAATNLRRQLLELEVESVERPSAGAAPPGSRAIELAALGAIVVGLQQPGVLDGVANVVRSWVGRDSGRSVKLSIGGDSIELSQISDEDQQRLLELWLERHKSS